MSRKLSLYHRAVLAWRDELEKQREATLADKRTKLRDGLRRKLTEMFGPEHQIEMEGERDSDDVVLEAMVENLNFLGFRDPAGEINVILTLPCPNCMNRMTSIPLNQLADVGRELLQLEMTGRLSNHECLDSNKSL